MPRFVGTRGIAVTIAPAWLSYKRYEIPPEGDLRRVTPRPSVRLRIVRSLVDLRVRLGQLFSRKQVLSISILSALVIAGFSIYQGAQTLAYLGVFGFSTFSSAILFLPSGRGAVMATSALVLNPLAVGIVSGIGGGLGEIAGYALGRSSRKLVKKSYVPAWLTRRVDKHMTLTLLFVSVVPNPFMDVVGIIAGRNRYPLYQFLACTIIGKVIQSVGFVYLVMWNLSLFRSM